MTEPDKAVERLAAYLAEAIGDGVTVSVADLHSVLSQLAAANQRIAKQDEIIAEERDDAHREGQSDATGAHADFWNAYVKWADERILLGDASDGYTADDLMTALVNHEDALLEAYERKVSKLVEANQRIAKLEESAKAWTPFANAAIKRVEAAEARLAEAIKVLKPFVRHYAPWMDEHADDVRSDSYSVVTFGDLRRAVSVIEGEKL